MTLLPFYGQELELTPSGPLGPSGFGSNQQEEKQEELRFAWTWRLRQGRGQEGGAGRGWDPAGAVAGWLGRGLTQGLAVAAGDRAQGVALVEVVYKAHAAAQHRAGAQEVRRPSPPC